jgi:hypothetical protein
MNMYDGVGGYNMQSFPNGQGQTSWSKEVNKMMFVVSTEESLDSYFKPDAFELWEVTQQP